MIVLFVSRPGLLERMPTIEKSSSNGNQAPVTNGDAGDEDFLNGGDEPSKPAVSVAPQSEVNTYYHY